MKKIILIILLFLLISNNSDDYFYSKASYYHDKFDGRKTASGEIFSNNKLTAAHKTIKFGTEIEVINIKNNKSIIVVINDRGPFTKGRDLDLSKTAFNQIGNINSGVIKIKYKIIK
jgi:rare lipoprotein A